MKPHPSGKTEASGTRRNHHKSVNQDESPQKRRKTVSVKV
jgi:hypothetical protein